MAGSSGPSPADLGRVLLGLGATADVAVGAVIKREGVELMSHCFTVRDDQLP
jgi:hypothetical protein